MFLAHVAVEKKPKCIMPMRPKKIHLTWTAGKPNYSG